MRSPIKITALAAVSLLAACSATAAATPIFFTSRQRRPPVLGPNYPVVAFRWLNSSEYTCSIGRSWGMHMIPRDRCSDLFVTAKHKAKLVFESVADRAYKAYLDQITC